jgi:hypothetical protein
MKPSTIAACLKLASPPGASDQRARPPRQSASPEGALFTADPVIAPSSLTEEVEHVPFTNRLLPTGDSRRKSAGSARDSGLGLPRSAASACRSLAGRRPQAPAESGGVGLDAQEAPFRLVPALARSPAGRARYRTTRDTVLALVRVVLFSAPLLARTIPPPLTAIISSSQMARNALSPLELENPPPICPSPHEDHLLILAVTTTRRA